MPKPAGVLAPPPDNNDTPFVLSRTPSDVLRGDTRRNPRRDDNDNFYPRGEPQQSFLGG